MDNLENIIAYLSEFALDDRFSLMQEKAASRTRYLTICLENVYQPQNTSAVLRSAEAFGIQDINIVETIHQYNVNPDIALGTDKWINLKRHESIESSVENLKKEGYRIVATIPKKDASNLENFDLSKGKAAFFFGTELTGLSDYAINNADEYLYIPMYGFVESLNISVSAAIIMQSLTSRLRNSTLNWQLSDRERNLLLLEWLKSSVRSSDMILQRYLEQKIN